MHSGTRFRPTRPIIAIMMFMTSAEVGIIACVKSNKDRRVLSAAPIFGGGFVSGDRLCPLRRKILAFSPSKWCFLMHSGTRFRPTRPIIAIMMFMTSAEVGFSGGEGGGSTCVTHHPLNTGLYQSSCHVAQGL